MNWTQILATWGATLISGVFALIAHKRANTAQDHADKSAASAFQASAAQARSIATIPELKQ